MSEKITAPAKDSEKSSPGRQRARPFVEPRAFAAPSQGTESSSAERPDLLKAYLQRRRLAPTATGPISQIARRNTEWSILPHAGRRVQRQIAVQNIDYDPVAQQFRHGNVDENNFYQALSQTLNAAPFMPGYRNRRANVIQAVRQQNYNQPDIDALTTAIAAAVRTEYGNQGYPMAANNLVTALENAVRDHLVANVQQGHQMDMDQPERQGFDQLAQANNAVLSRAKGTPSTTSAPNGYAGLSRPSLVIGPSEVPLVSKSSTTKDTTRAITPTWPAGFLPSLSRLTRSRPRLWRSTTLPPRLCKRFSMGRIHGPS